MKSEIDEQISQRKEPMHEFWNKGGFVLCTSGCADIYINDKIYHLKVGNIFFVTPLIRIYKIKPSSDFERISFIGELKIFYPVFSLISDTGIPLKISMNPVWMLSEKEISFVRFQYKRISEKLTEIGGNNSHDEQQLLTTLVNLICVETMLEIVSHLLRNYEVSIKSIRNADVAYRFILELHENYNSERTVSRYAANANMSTGHFTSIIREATGRTPSEWISEVTTTYAKLLLEQTDKSIKEIAIELNFPEQFTFRKYFKKNAGISPTDYRNKIRGLS